MVHAIYMIPISQPINIQLVVPRSDALKCISTRKYNLEAKLVYRWAECQTNMKFIAYIRII